MPFLKNQNPLVPDNPNFQPPKPDSSTNPNTPPTLPKRPDLLHNTNLPSEPKLPYKSIIPEKKDEEIVGQFKSIFGKTGKIYTTEGVWNSTPSRLYRDPKIRDRIKKIFQIKSPLKRVTGNEIKEEIKKQIEELDFNGNKIVTPEEAARAEYWNKSKERAKKRKIPRNVEGYREIKTIEEEAKLREDLMD